MPLFTDCSDGATESKDGSRVARGGSSMAGGGSRIAEGGSSMAEGGSSMAGTLGGIFLRAPTIYLFLLTSNLRARLGFGYG